jgi:hypothetical protein
MLECHRIVSARYPFRFRSFWRDPSNAAPEWQAKSMWWRSRDLVVACPLEGLVRGLSGAAA